MSAVGDANARVRYRRRRDAGLCIWRQAIYRLKHAGLALEEIEKARYAVKHFIGICDACWEHNACGFWCLDHDHETKKFRGIIGQRCNVALGAVKDNIGKLYRLGLYLEKKR